MTQATPLHDMSWLPTDTTSLTDAAVAYASHGFLVLPVWGVRIMADRVVCQCGRPECSAPGKHPLERAWQKRATSDVDAVRDARRTRADANVGLAMGGPMRLVAVDIDGPDGRASWAALEDKHGPAPTTLTSRSGRADGGEHRLFTVPKQLDIKRLGNRASFALKGIDTRIDNGQIVAAPSIHRSGSRYTWSVRAPIAEMPEWLFDELAAPKPVRRAQADQPATAPTASGPQDSKVASLTWRYYERALRNACTAIAAQQEGGRNQLLFAKATTVFEYCVGEGFAYLDAWRELAAAAATCGLGIVEIENVLGKAWRQAQVSPRRVPPQPPRPAGPPNVPPPGGGGGGGEGGEPDDSWRKQLDLNTEGFPKKTLANVTTILALHPSWRGVIAYDAFAECVVTTTPPPVRQQDAPERHVAGEWSDEDSIRTSNWLSEQFSFDVPTGVVDQAVAAVARRKTIHPVRDYLSRLEWDGVARLDGFLSTYFGAADTEYTRGVGSRWMISAVARVFRPGCQADCTLVLESPGKQGVGKSTGLEALAGRDWFSDTGIVVGDKDSYQALRRKWIYELAELSSLKGRDVERVKAFLSARSDNYRVSYGRRNNDFPRQVVFAGTTNESQYLQDRTGNRRFWPVRVVSVDRDALVRDRDQLWAEARVRFERGEAWHVDTPHFRALCEEEQAERVHDDPWEPLVAEWIAGGTITRFDPTDRLKKSRRIDPALGVTTADVLLGAIDMRPGDINRQLETRAGEVLRALGWEPFRPRVEFGRRERRYRPAQPAVQPVQPTTQTGWTGIPSSSSTVTSVVQPVQPQTEISEKFQKNREPDPQGYGGSRFLVGPVGPEAQVPATTGGIPVQPPGPTAFDGSDQDAQPGAFDDLLDDE